MSTATLVARAAEGEAKSALLRINGIFFSLQGETRRVRAADSICTADRLPVALRLLRSCAFHEGSSRSVGEVWAAVAAYDAHHATVTGGEPLAQKHCLSLLATLGDNGYSVALETSGAIDIAGVDSRVSRIVDINTPGSNEVDRDLGQSCSADVLP